MALSVANIANLALSLESLLYGVFIILYCIMVFLVRTVPTNSWAPDIGFIVIYCGTIVFLLVSAHLVIDIVQAFKLFNVFPIDTSGNLYLSVSNNTFLAKSSIWVLQIFTGDVTLIWRCYTVYGNRFKYVVVPIVGSVSYLGASGITLYKYAHASVGADHIVQEDFWKWSIIYICSTLLVNIYCSAVIGWRISQTTRSLKMRTTNTRTVLIAVVEAGALYVAGHTVLLATVLARSYVQYIAMDILSPFAGITSTLVGVHIRAYDLFRAPRSNTSPPTAAGLDTHQRSAGRVRSREMPPIVVTVERRTEIQLDLTDRHDSDASSNSEVK